MDKRPPLTAQEANEMWLRIDKEPRVAASRIKGATKKAPLPFVNHVSRYRRLRRDSAKAA